MYIKDSDKTKHHITAIRPMFPHMGIPDGADLSAIGYLPFVETAQPEPGDWQTVIESTPVKVGGTYEQRWQVVAMTAEQVAELKSNLVRKIDSDADSIYTAALGNRATEYAQAEADATAYKAASYSGQVPGYVQAWATATNKTAQWAADDILATAQGWRNAQAAIRLNRLTCKEAARAATTPSGVATIEAQWAGFLSAIKTQLGIS